MRPNRVTRACSLAVSAAALACLGAPLAHADAPASVGIAALNAQREANGLPGGIVENPAWSAGCDRHIGYMAANGGELTHDERSGNPGYSAEGDDAGNSSVLSRGDSWTTGNPWEHAPIHLHQLLGPRLSVTGVADRDGYVCMFTWPGYQRPAPSAWLTYTYPGPGTSGFRFEETAAESPFTPGEKVGIPEGTKTGPYLYVMFDGPFTSADARATGASLIGPDGPVDIAVVDNETPGAGGYLPAGMELIPRQPLRPRATYTATIAATVSANGTADAFGTVDQPVQHAWSFTTSARPNQVAVELRQGSSRASQAELSVSSDASSPSVTLTGPGGASVRPALKDGQALVDLPVAGRWTACASSGGPSSEYDASSDCANRTFPARLAIKLPTRITHRRLRLAVPAAAVGRRARVIVWATRGGSLKAHVDRSIRLRRTTTIALPAASGARRWDITISTKSFSKAGVRYERLLLNRAYRSVG